MGERPGRDTQSAVEPIRVRAAYPLRRKFGCGSSRMRFRTTLRVVDARPTPEAVRPKELSSAQNLALLKLPYTIHVHQN